MPPKSQCLSIRSLWKAMDQLEADIGEPSVRDHFKGIVRHDRAFDDPSAKDAVQRLEKLMGESIETPAKVASRQRNWR